MQIQPTCSRACSIAIPVRGASRMCRSLPVRRSRRIRPAAAVPSRTSTTTACRHCHQQPECPALAAALHPAEVNHWLNIKLEGIRSHRSAIGARVVCKAGALSQIDEVRSGGSYLSHNDLAYTSDSANTAPSICRSALAEWQRRPLHGSEGRYMDPHPGRRQADGPPFSLIARWLIRCAGCGSPRSSTRSHIGCGH